MSSPLARKKTNRLHDLLIRTHQKNFHGSRVQAIGKHLAAVIAEEFRQESKIKCLDFGCGDMRIAACIHKELPQTSWIGADIHDAGEGVILPFAYKKIVGCALPFEDNEFDAVVLSDVLHHIPLSLQKDAIAECARIGRLVVVKDHFEHGIVSRLVLMAMDFAGNWAYGVSVPKRYFSEQSFAAFCAESGIDVDMKMKSVDLHGHLPGILRCAMKPELHFIATARRSKGAWDLRSQV